MEPIAHVFHADRLRSLVDGKTYARGEAYFREGRVGALHKSGATVTARVAGSSAYDVKLWVKSGRIAYACSCPVGGEGDFCKHCVAVSLAVLSSSAPRAAEAAPDASPAPAPGAADTTEGKAHTVLVLGDDGLVTALGDFDELRIARDWSLDTAEAADLVALCVGEPVALLALGLLATTGKLIVCCAPDHPQAGVVDAVCRRHGIHLTHAPRELHVAVRARLESLGLGGSAISSR